VRWSGVVPAGRAVDTPIHVTDWLPTLLAAAGGHRLELYDLRRNMGETMNLAARQPERAAALRQTLHAWMKSVPSRFPARIRNSKRNDNSWRSNDEDHSPLFRPPIAGLMVLPVTRQFEGLGHFLRNMLRPISSPFAPASPTPE